MNRGCREFPNDLWDLLIHGDMDDCQLVPRGSNYTFNATLSYDTKDKYKVIYKPRRGEVPLWDFPDGTLYLREYAGWLLSEALGWRFVPPTILREGVYGEGSVQLYIESIPSENYFTMRDEFKEDLMRICIFDFLANNADRKASHCLLGLDGCIWSIDHGITFHSEPKLRTVIWDFSGEPVPQFIMDDIDKLEDQFASKLKSLLRDDEIEAFQYRLDMLLDNPRFPVPGRGPFVPWPWI